MFSTKTNKLYKGIDTTEPLEFKADTETVQIDNCRIVLSKNGKTNIRCYGNGVFIVSNSVLSSDADVPDSELITIEEGANVYFYRCRFQNSGKGVLIGSDNQWSKEHGSISATFVECLFEDIGKWNPFGKYGQIRLFRCLIKNWGGRFIGSDGFRVGKHAQGLAGNCVFVQKPLLSCLNRNIIQDMLFQGFPFLIPGFAKAAYAEYGGQIRLYNCYKNRWWLYLKNHYGRYMSQEEAKELESYIETVTPKISPTETVPEVKDEK